MTTFPRLLLEHAAGAPDAPALREKDYGIWQTLTWAPAGRDGARPRLRTAAAGLDARPAPRRHRREPAAPVRVDAGRAVARRGAGAAVPGRGRRRVRLPDQQRRGRLRDRRGPGAGRQAARDARAVPAARAHLVRRSARPAQLQRARAGVARRAAARPARGARPRQPDAVRRRGRRRSTRTTSPRCSSPRARPASRRAWCTRTSR